jgi:hypothetical protein
MTTGWWVCGNFHVFPYGNEEWHAEFDQADGVEETPIPYYCQVGTCMDSSHLWGPHPSEANAKMAATIKETVAKSPPLTAEQRDKLALLLKPAVRGVQIRTDSV